MKTAAAALLTFPLLAGVASSHGKPVVKRVNPATLATPTGYSHVVEVTGGRTLYVSGQVARDQAGNLVGKGDLKAQTVQVFENLKSALAGSGATLGDVVKITIFMTDVSGLQTLRQVRDSYIPKDRPASSLVQVSRLAHPDFLIEIEAVAVVE
jgi:reactive intermediate/imine deaminase